MTTRRTRVLTASGRTGFVCDSTNAWNSRLGDKLLVAVEDERGQLVGWFELRDVTPLPSDQATLFDPVEAGARGAPR